MKIAAHVRDAELNTALTGVASQLGAVVESLEPIGADTALSGSVDVLFVEITRDTDV